MKKVTQKLKKLKTKTATKKNKSITYEICKITNIYEITRKVLNNNQRTLEFYDNISNIDFENVTNIVRLGKTILFGSFKSTNINKEICSIYLVGFEKENYYLASNSEKEIIDLIKFDISLSNSIKLIQKIR